MGCPDKPTLEELKKFAATEKYPEDVYLDTVTEKRALIVVAHDDDDCAMSGTIAKLHSQGWKISQLSFVANKAEKGVAYHPSSVICDGNEAILNDRIYRNDADSSNIKHMPLPKDKFDQIFFKEKIMNELSSKVNKFNPRVIFTLDNEIGGYGHPDHVFLSQLVLDMANGGLIHPDRIYQSVYTNHMEEEIVEKWLTERLKSWGYDNMYLIAKQVYVVSGMPEPNVEINITNEADTKMKYLLRDCYEIT